jgi:hypothetical protein
MNKNLYVFLALFSILNISCVENVIFIQVYPDGQTYFKFFSVGDSTDIYDKDFLHPLKNNWNGKSSFNLSKTDSIWEMTTEAIYQDSVFIFEPSNSLSFKMERSEEQKALSSFYNIKMDFIEWLTLNEKIDKELLEKIKNIESKIDFLVKNSK